MKGGRFAVILFFVLSGFVLALPYHAGTNQAYFPYLVRRVCRLYPTFCFAILAATLLSFLVSQNTLSNVSEWLNGLWSPPLTTDVVISHLSMTGTKDAIRLDGPIWSLIIEMRISIIFPLLVLYCSRFEWPGIVASLIVAIGAEIALGEPLPIVAETFPGAILLTLRYIPFFLLGILAAARLNDIREALKSFKFSAAAFVLVMIVAPLTYLLLHALKLVGQGFADVVYSLAAIYLIASAVVFSGVSSILSGRVFLWLGDISYSLYLIHLPVLLAIFHLCSARMSFVEMIVIALPTMLIAAHLMHILIERPSIRIGHRLAGAKPVKSQ